MKVTWDDYSIPFPTEWMVGKVPLKSHQPGLLQLALMGPLVSRCLLQLRDSSHEEHVILLGGAEKRSKAIGKSSLNMGPKPSGNGCFHEKIIM